MVAVSLSVAVLAPRRVPAPRREASQDPATQPEFVRKPAGARFAPAGKIQLRGRRWSDAQALIATAHRLDNLVHHRRMMLAARASVDGNAG
jgi:hypothetical protein